MRLKVVCGIFLFLLAALPSVSYAQQGTPTPVEIPAQQMFEQLATQNANLYSIPDLPVFPEDRSSQILGYAKWITTPGIAEEIFGLFHPLFSAIGLLLLTQVVLNGIYVVAWIIAQIVRWIVWLIRLILDVIQGVANALDSLIGWLFKILGIT
jgi:hypothetical protein